MSPTLPNVTDLLRGTVSSGIMIDEIGEVPGDKPVSSQLFNKT
jgi:hypothetical protein